MGDGTLPGGGREPEETALARALHCPPLSADALSRIHGAADSEWRSLAATPRRRTPWLVAAVILGAAGTVGLAWWVAAHRAPNSSIGTVAAGDSAALVIEHQWLPDEALSGGHAVAVGSTLQARRTAIVAIAGGGRLLIQQGSRLLVDGAHALTLRRGAVYVDLDPAMPHGRLDVRTAFGVVRHVGTQFEVALLRGAMRVRVREGAVRIDGPVAAQAQAGQEVEVVSGGLPRYQRFESNDAAWAWVQLAVALRLENRSVMSFLRWVARETGCRLQFADEQSRLLAERTVLHGSMREMPAEAALRAVLGTTSLTASLNRGTILVQRANAAPPTTL